MFTCSEDRPSRFVLWLMRCKGVVVFSSDNSPGHGARVASVAHPVANRAIVCHVIDALHSAGIREVAVVAPAWLLPKIRTRVVDARGTAKPVEYLDGGEGGGLLSALRRATSFVGDDACMVHLADGLTGQALAAFAKVRRDEPHLTLLLHRSATGEERVSAATLRLLGMAELTGTTRHLGLAGVCVFGPGAFRPAMGRAVGGGGDFAALFAAIAGDMAATGASLQAGFVRDWRRAGGDPHDLIELNRLALDSQPYGAEPFDCGDNRIEGSVRIHPSAEVTHSIVVGPSIIGEFARVADSYVGPYTSIGPRAEIEGAEIERSIILEGARIVHIGSRIEESTIGRGANISRDFSIPRAIRLHVGDDVEVALS
jgi:glucose-1-phosphate thymidylyltransferase